MIKFSRTFLRFQFPRCISFAEMDVVKEQSAMDLSNVVTYDLSLNLFQLLPDAILTEIVSYLSLKDVIGIERVCKLFRKEFEKDEMFRILLLRRGVSSKDSSTWKKEYLGTFYLMFKFVICDRFHRSPKMESC